MTIVQIGILGICGTLGAVFLKQLKPEYGTLLIIVTGILIFANMFQVLENFLGAVRVIKTTLQLDRMYLDVILKVIGISYVSEFAASICKDAGNQSIASQIEIFGKLSILSLSIPILLALLQCIGEFLK